MNYEDLEDSGRLVIVVTSCILPGRTREKHEEARCGLSVPQPIFRHILTKLHGLSPRANYTDRETAACRRSDCQLLRIEGATWSA
jgi:hypothetical protein